MSLSLTNNGPNEKMDLDLTMSCPNMPYQRRHGSLKTCSLIRYYVAILPRLQISILSFTIHTYAFKSSREK